MKEMAHKTAQEDTGTSSGFILQGAEYEGGVCNGLEYVWTHGSRTHRSNVLDPEDPSKVVIDSPEPSRASRPSTA
jgi:multiple sugar transport system substrate-binding protein